MALLGVIMPPAMAATLMVVPSLLTNIAQCLGPHAGALTRRLWPMWLALVAVTLFSPLPDVSASGGVARLTLGVVLAIYGVWGLAKPRLPDFGRHALAIGGIAGAISGVLTAATGVFVMPMVPYLQSLQLTKDELVQALGLSFTVATLALMLRLGHAGAGDLSPNIGAVVLATVTAFAGMWGGARLRHLMQPLVFQRVLYAVFVLLGVIMLGRSL
jgi:uncharacterized membrane protein YfcA